MNQRLIVSSALASVMSLSLIAQAGAQDMSKDTKGKEEW